MQFRPLASVRYLLIAGLIVVGLVTFASRSRYAQTTVPDRVGEIDSSSYTAIQGNVRGEAQPQYDRGPVEDSFRLDNIIMAFAPSPDQAAALQKLLGEQLDPSSTNYHRWLTPEQFAGQFGLSQSDVSRIVSWLEDQGFTINLTARGRMWVSFSGTAAQVSAAFHTPIHRYVVNGETHYANAVEPSVPSALAGVVLGFQALDDFRPRPRTARWLRTVGPRPEFTSSITGNHFLAPYDFAVIYALRSLYDAGFTGSGQKIAVMGQTDFQLSDIEAFRTASGLSANNPVTLLVPGSPDPGTNSGDLIEADLDLEWSGGLAPSAPILYVNSTNSFNSLLYAIDGYLAPVLTISYGTCEADAGLAFTNTLALSAEQANAQGMTLVAAAGDDGAADCDTGTPTAPPVIATQGLAVDVPAAVPYFTGVGGTEFNEGSGKYWASTNNAQMGSALSYIPESAWNETVQDGALAAGGGGVSMFFTKPSWQTGKGVPDDGHRDVPDIALNASAAHDPYLICTSGSCVNGFRAANNSLQVVGGTSAGTPSFAAVMALIDQRQQSPQGNVNPVLYSLAATSPGAFHDITTGNNMVPCQAGTPDCPNGGEIGYNAGPGYDLATGLGSIDAQALASAWPASSAPPPPPGFQMSLSPSTLTLSPGGSATATVTITGVNGFNGTVNFSTGVAATLSGVTGTLSPTSVTGNGTTTLTVTASQTARFLPRGRFPGGFDVGGALRLGLALIFVLGACAFRLRSRSMRPRTASAGTRIWLGLALACLLAAGISCGGGSSNPSDGTNTAPPAESGNLSVNASSGTLSQSVSISITVN
jgi:subtilase family serine protease